MMSGEHSREAPVVFTDSAAAKVYELIKEEENYRLNLRVFITGGGCSGFQYGFTFDETIQGDDTVIKKVLQAANEEMQGDEEDDGGEGGEGGDGSGGGIIVRLLIDPMSFQYLAGAEIDYKEDVNGARFIIRNPNAKTTCGCGSSFSA